MRKYDSLAKLQSKDNFNTVQLLMKNSALTNQNSQKRISNQASEVRLSKPYLARNPSSTTAGGMVSVETLNKATHRKSRSLLKDPSTAYFKVEHGTVSFEDEPIEEVNLTVKPINI